MLIVLLLVLPAAATPVAAAGLVNRNVPVVASVQVPSDPSRLRDDAFLVSGAASFSGAMRGIVLGGGDRGSAFQFARIEVYRMDDAQAYVEGRPTFAAESARLEPVAGGAFAWSLGLGQATAATPYTTLVVLDVESRLAELGPFLPARGGGPMPHLVLDGRGGSWSIDVADGRDYFLPLVTPFNVSAGASTRTFSAAHFAVLKGNGTADLDATALAFPTHETMEVTVRRADDSAYTRAFTTSRLREYVDTAIDLARKARDLEGPPEFTPPPGCPEDPLACLPFPPGAVVEGTALRIAGASSHGGGSAENASAEQALGIPDGLLETAGSIFNGALIGNLTGNVTLGQRETSEPALSVVRFDRVTLSDFGEGRANLTGSSPFAYTGGRAYHTTATAVDAGVFIIPVLSLILFIVAIVLFIVSRVRRRPDEERTRGSHLGLVSRVFWILALVVAFVLFDRELFVVFGESLLGTLGLWGGAGFSWSRLGFIALVELLVWGYASLLFGLPVAVGGRAALRLGGVSKRANGFASGAAALAVFVLGATLIRPILGAVLDAVAGAA